MEMASNIKIDFLITTVYLMNVYLRRALGFFLLCLKKCKSVSAFDDLFHTDPEELHIEQEHALWQDRLHTFVLASINLAGTSKIFN